MVESIQVEKQDQKKHKPKSKVGYLKMVGVEDLGAATINYKVDGKISPDACVVTDGYKGYARLKEKIKWHKAINMTGVKQVHKTFSWVHREYQENTERNPPHEGECLSAELSQ